MLCVQANTKNSTGCVSLDVNLLKPSRVEFLQEPSCSLTVSDGSASSPTWLEYVYRTAHPALRWLPTKLAEWIGENMQDALGFANKADTRHWLDSSRVKPYPQRPCGGRRLDNLWMCGMGVTAVQGARCVPDAIPLI